jgi:hypothetical protein
VTAGQLSRRKLAGGGTGYPTAPFPTAVAGAVVAGGERGELQVPGGLTALGMFDNEEYRELPIPR